MFIDDVVAGDVEGNAANSIYYELTALMKTKLPMAKWASKWEELQEIWKAGGQEILRST
jgi:uncharacterized protein (DUF2236 family)